MFAFFVRYDAIDDDGDDDECDQHDQPKGADEDGAAVGAGGLFAVFVDVGDFLGGFEEAESWGAVPDLFENASGFGENDFFLDVFVGDIVAPKRCDREVIVG